MRHGTRQLSEERTRHVARRPATGRVLRRQVAGFCSAVDSGPMPFLQDQNLATSGKRYRRLFVSETLRPEQYGQLLP